MCVGHILIQYPGGRRARTGRGLGVALGQDLAVGADRVHKHLVALAQRLGVGGAPVQGQGHRRVARFGQLHVIAY
jgi:hypothetical protein